MPKGPQGQKRPADVNARAVMIAKIATGEIDDSLPEKSASAIAGSQGGHQRARNLTDAERKAIAQKAAKSRWKTKKAAPAD